MTQSQQILCHLRGGHVLTPVEALEKFGTFRLAAPGARSAHSGLPDRLAGTDIAERGEGQ